MTVLWMNAVTLHQSMQRLASADDVLCWVKGFSQVTFAGCLTLTLTLPLSANTPLWLKVDGWRLKVDAKDSSLSYLVGPVWPERGSWHGDRWGAQLVFNLWLRRHTHTHTQTVTPRYQEVYQDITHTHKDNNKHSAGGSPLNPFLTARCFFKLRSRFRRFWKMLCYGTLWPECLYQPLRCCI